MDKTNDLVMGAILGYRKEQVQYWVNSLNRCGFKGTKHLVCFDIDQDTLSWLRDQGVVCYVANTITKNPHFSIVVDRFLFYYRVLSDLTIPVRHVVLTDVKDVVFQLNPSEVMEKIFTSYNAEGCQYLLSSEDIHYANEPWGNNNLRLSFPQHYGRLLDSVIVNCGVIAGKFQSIRDLCSQLYYMCGRSSPHIQGGGGPDQAALNILMNQEPYNDLAYRANIEDAWAAQLGTTADPLKIYQFEPLLTNHRPIIDESGVVRSHHQKLYAIVHQWDRLASHHVQRIKERYS